MDLRAAQQMTDSGEQHTNGGSPTGAAAAAMEPELAKNSGRLAGASPCIALEAVPCISSRWRAARTESAHYAVAVTASRTHSCVGLLLRDSQICYRQSFQKSHAMRKSHTITPVHF